jgi:adenylate kinase
MRLRKAARVILVGAPGVGKGTQSERLLHRFPQLQSISTGDLLRSNVRSRTPLGRFPPTRLDLRMFLLTQLMA